MTLITIAAVIVLAPACLLAQQGDTAQKKNGAAATESKVLDPTLTSNGSGAATGVAFRLGSDEKSATAQVGGTLSGGFAFGLSVAGPVSKSATDNTVLTTGEALAAGTTLELSIRHLNQTRSKAPISDEALSDMCRRFAAKATQSSGHYDCSRLDMSDEGKRALDMRAFPAIWTWGASFKGGTDKYSYTDASTFADHSDQHTGWSAAATLGVFPKNHGDNELLYYVGLSARHESAYKAGQSRSICTPIAMSTSSVCRDIATGAPARRNTNILQVEARSFPVAGFGLAPKLTYEADGRTWSADVPIYVRGSTSEPFNGGVDASWNSKDHTVNIGVFIGAIPGAGN